MPSSNKWDASSMSQTDFMERDTVLVLSNDDMVIGSASKRESHEFNPSQPRGVLHRAFSVFLFDSSTAELLLQKRASTKITFPGVWTNTCCSHPLHGMDVNEVDGPDDLQAGTVPGVKAAAVRKLQHELGILKEQLRIDDFKFLTRLHYWAADTLTHGKQSPWGEHEIDYVLFLTVPSKDCLTINPHPEEVDDVRWVTQPQLMKMFADTSLLFSPWFRIIVNRWMIGNVSNDQECKVGWWDDLNRTMKTNCFCDYDKIHRFDPPREHMGGGGDAGPLFEGEDSFGHEQAFPTVAANRDNSKKQGAYGKVKIHKESKLKQLLHFDEVFSAISLLYLNPLKSNLSCDYIKATYNSCDLSFCDDILCKVSRSFAAVIRQLPPTLLVDVLVFYLVLRALDTIEDDMTFFDSNGEKIKLLKSFHRTALIDPSWSLMGCGDGDERRLLENFHKCHSVYAALPESSRCIISDITRRMSVGMAEFVEKDLGQGTIDIHEYDRYCHFVAGLVGEGLSRLFSNSRLESPSLATEQHLSNNMGLFLQKTNIIRDYLEDYVDGRAFWPQCIWKKYSLNGDLGYFANPKSLEARTRGLFCLNEMITDALELVPDCLSYLSMLRCSEVFRFCAIPQVMAIATLEKCYHNADVFTGVVKIRKGMSCLLINSTNDIQEVHFTFNKFASKIKSKAELAKRCGFQDPSYDRTINACQAILEISDIDTKRGAIHASLINSSIFVASASISCLMFKKTQPTTNQVVITAAAFTSIGLLSFMKMGFMKHFCTTSSLLPAAKLCKD